MDYAKRMMADLDRSVSSYHAVKNIENQLKDGGFEEIFETKPFVLEKGKGYFVKRNDSSIIAFRIPEGDFFSFHILASHSDSPTYKLKTHPAYDNNGYIGLRVEPYGGMIASTWFDRPLSIAGRVMVEKGNEVKTRLVDIDEDIAIIPNLCIHFAKDMEEKKINPDTEVIPLLGNYEDGFDFPNYLKAKAGLEEGEKILSGDLFLYARTSSRLVGANKDFLSSPRLDNLTSAYSSTYAMLDSATKGSVSVMAVFDNEEVGSSSRQGAFGDFLVSVLSRICKVFGKESEIIYANSFLLSVDNAHARHPNYPSVFERSSEVNLNGGVVLKYNASLHYTTDAYSAALVKKLALKAGVPIQLFSNRPDMRGGKTLGNLVLNQLSIPSADIGLPQLAMHSSFETMGTDDIAYMVDLLKAFFETEFTLQEDGFALKEN